MTVDGSRESGPSRVLQKPLVEDVLLNPARQGATQFVAIAGYATAAMARQHMETLAGIVEGYSVEVIVGMYVLDGVPLGNHEELAKLASEERNFGCFYSLKPIHSKLYIWLREGVPVVAFCGSSNYTISGFLRSIPEEILSGTDVNTAMEYYMRVRESVVAVEDARETAGFSFYREDREWARQTPVPQGGQGPSPRGRQVSVSLLSGEDVPRRSGLNWGQRPELRREPNQAYLPLPASVYNSDYPLPPIGVRFLLLTDDGRSFVAARAQQNGKAIHTPDDNSQLGLYFRRRIGIAEGALLTREHLSAYGRTDYTLEALDAETYLLDFSPDS